MRLQGPHVPPYAYIPFPGEMFRLLAHSDPKKGLLGHGLCGRVIQRLAGLGIM